MNCENRNLSMIYDMSLILSPLSLVISQRTNFANAITDNNTNNDFIYKILNSKQGNFMKFKEFRSNSFTLHIYFLFSKK